MEDKVQTVINLIKQTDLDQTIKDILIRDLQKEGLTDFLREQIKAYCFEGIKELNEIAKKAGIILEEQKKQNPGQ
jgi:pimeloyl-CoA synthetase